MKKTTITLILILAAALFGAVKLVPLYIGNDKFLVEIADTPQKQMTGLMYRESIPDDFGMLFVFPREARRHFWMKNTLVHLDLIFLNRHKQIVHIRVNAPPCRSEPCDLIDSLKPAMYVLELRGNRSRELGLKVGDHIFFVLD